MEEIRCRMENSLRHSLLCMETELTEEEVFGCYENKMLLNTEISGVLPVSFRAADGRGCFCYDASNAVSLEQFFENRSIGEDFLRRFVEQLNLLLETLERYLLSEERVLWEPSLIFYEEGRMRLLFALLPGKQESFLEGLRRFFRWVLEHIDYDSEQTIVLAYRLLRKLSRESFKIGDFLQVVRQEREEMCAESAETDGVFRFVGTERALSPASPEQEPGGASAAPAGIREREDAAETVGDKESERVLQPESGAEYEIDLHAGAEKPCDLPAWLARYGKLLLGVLLLAGIPGGLFLLEGRESLLHFLPLVLLIDGGIVLCLIMDAMLLRLPETES
ncbi:MAG: DUF6382 domain-containing protein [Oribacterium sp.]